MHDFVRKVAERQDATLQQIGPIPIPSRYKLTVRISQLSWLGILPVLFSNAFVDGFLGPACSCAL